MGRDSIIAVTAAQARSAGQVQIERGADFDEVAVVVMGAAKQGMFAPGEMEAFAAAVGALIELYPDRADDLLAETRAIGYRNNVLESLVAGVPVDLERALDEAPAPPDETADLLRLWLEADA